MANVPTIPRTQLVMDLITALANASGNPPLISVTEETGYALFAGPEILSDPDRAIFVTPAGGPGWVTEEAALDTWSFQLRVRGPDDDPLAPELAIQQLDFLLFGANTMTVDGIYVATITRVGSPPVPLPLNPQDRRFEYTCSYLITTGGG